MKKSTLFILIILSFSGTVNAQFFKNLGEKIEKAAERAVQRKAQQKTTKETEKAFDSVFNKKNGGKSGQPAILGVSNIQPADHYSFNHKAVMEIKSGNQTSVIDYYLPNFGDFFGMEIKDKRVKEEFITVYDVGREAMFTFMENNGKKIKMGIEFKTDNTSVGHTDYDIKATGNTKTIIGYTCKEYVMSSDDMNATIWVTKDVEFRFPSVIYNKSKNKGKNQKWMNDLDGLAMEMKLIDISGKKPHTIIMKCLAIQNSDLKITSNNYQNLGNL